MPRRNHRATRKSRRPRQPAPTPERTTDQMAADLVRRGLASPRIVTSTKWGLPATPEEGQRPHALDQ